MTDVRDFGAAGDGQVDDSDSIQHALDQGGGHLVLPPGTYRITRPITVDLARRGRTAISGEALDEEGRNLVLAKDALFVASAVTGLISILSGLSLARQAPDGATPIETGTTPASDTPEEAASLLRRVNLLGNLNLALIGGIGAITTILSQKAGKSTRWSAVSRFLP